MPTAKPSINLSRAALRRAAIRALLGLTLVTPAAALAADGTPSPAPSGKRATKAAENGKRNASKVLRPAVVLDDQRGALKRIMREVRVSARPTHPVPGAVDYGDALAAFGNARGRPHEGQDIFAPAGRKLVAAADAVVVDGGSDGGRGTWVALHDRRREVTYSYFHMLGSAEVEVGQRVRAGQKVGEVGCTGSCSGDHLHFELREGRGPYGTAIDPTPFLKRAR